MIKYTEFIKDCTRGQHKVCRDSIYVITFIIYTPGSNYTININQLKLNELNKLDEDLPEECP